METLLSAFRVRRSRSPSTSRSARDVQLVGEPTGNGVLGAKENPDPVPNRIVRLLSTLLGATMSITPSPLISPVAKLLERRFSRKADAGIIPKAPVADPVATRY